MAELAAALAKADEPAKADTRPVHGGELRMTLDWEKCSELTGELLLRTADLELIRRRNRSDVEALYLPYIRMFSVLGTLQLEGVFQNSRLEFSGYLARAEVAAVMESQ